MIWFYTLPGKFVPPSGPRESSYITSGFGITLYLSYPSSALILAKIEREHGIEHGRPSITDFWNTQYCCFLTPRPVLLIYLLDFHTACVATRALCILRAVGGGRSEPDFQKKIGWHVPPAVVRSSMLHKNAPTQ